MEPAAQWMEPLFLGSMRLEYSRVESIIDLLFARAVFSSMCRGLWCWRGLGSVELFAGRSFHVFAGCGLKPSIVCDEHCVILGGCVDVRGVVVG